MYPITWSPDGTQLAYQAENDIYVVSVAGVVPVNLTNAGPDEINQHPAWSPDGRHIAFASTRGNHGLRSGLRIYLMNADGSNPVKLTEGQAESPSWSPDGSKIVFMSNRRTHHFDIWMVNPDGSNPVRVSQVAASEDAQMFPAWSPLPGVVVAPSAVRALSWGQVKAGGW